MLNSDIEQAAVVRDAFKTADPLCVMELRALSRVFAKSRVVTQHFFHRWPILRLVGGQTSLHGVDAESKEAIEIGIKRYEPERLKEKIPIERLR